MATQLADRIPNSDRRSAKFGPPRFRRDLWGCEKELLGVVTHCLPELCSCGEDLFFGLHYIGELNPFQITLKTFFWLSVYSVTQPVPNFI